MLQCGSMYHARGPRSHADCAWGLPEAVPQAYTPWQQFRDRDEQSMAEGGPDTAAMQVRLLAMQAEIEELIESSADSRRPVALDQSSVGRLSRMDAMQQQAMALATQRQRHQQLLRIGAALRRIREGEYGYCTVCGSPIAPSRLDLDPATPACVGCSGRKP
jgi:DnaK suppressor protein